MAWLAFNLCLAAGAAQAEPPALTLDRLFEICGSRLVTEAAAKGDGLGWQRLSEAETREWRQAFLRYNGGGSLQSVGWRRGEQGRGDSLSFWIAEGPNGHKACAYSKADATGLLEELSEHVGKPIDLDKNEALTSAHWKTGSIEIYFSQVGSSALVNISQP